MSDTLLIKIAKDRFNNIGSQNVHFDGLKLENVVGLLRIALFNIK